MLPRLPNELPPPARASASPGDKTIARNAKPARRTGVRRIEVRFEVLTGAIWGAASVKARGYHDLTIMTGGYHDRGLS
jgi:hypothetical protein